MYVSSQRQPAVVCRLILVAALWLCPLAARAAKYSVRLVAPTSDPVRATITAQPVAGGMAMTVNTQAAGYATVELPSPIDWSLRVDAPGYWAQDRFVDGASTAPIEVILWPAGVVQGSIASRTPVNRMTIRFRPITTIGPPAGQSSCPVDKEKWSCVLPAGTFDLSIRPDNAIAEHRWELPIPRGGAADAGPIRVRPGASVSGRVVLGPGVRSNVGRILVSLVPEFASEPVSDRDRAQRTSLVQTTSVSRRGFFFFDGVTPGQYVVRAKLPGTTEAKSSVIVLPDREAELVHPLTLDTPKSLIVNVRPTESPEGKWLVRLARETASHSYEEVNVSPASPLGEWKRHGLASGKYVLMIMTSSGTRWSLQEIILGDRSETVTVNVPLINVTGKVLLGDRPVRATVWFGGTHGPTAVPIKGGEDGTFEGVVPAPPSEGWPELTITADEPTLRRTLRTVKPRYTGDADAVVDITLPDGLVEGSVRDQDGKVINNALVTLHAAHAEAAAQLRSGIDGTFSFSGLAPGHYALRAEAGDRESDWLEIDVSERKPTRLELVLAKKTRLTGRVMSDHGPIPGAGIDAFPLEHRYPSWARTSDAEGNFQLRLPAWTRTIALAARAPGHAFRLMRVSLDKNSPLVVALTQSGGRLTYTVPEAINLRDVWLLHAGAAVLAAFLPEMSGGNATTTNEDRHLTAPFVEAGDYAICLATDEELPLLLSGVRPPATCATGILPPGGELALSLRVSKTGS